jgi:hypothetical protein
MNASFLLIIAVVVMQLALPLKAMEKANLQEQKQLLWPNSKAYRTKVKSFRFNDAQALNLLIEVAKRRNGVYFDKNPSFIFGSEYFFASIPDKMAVPLTGYYVDGMTGKIIYRKSKHKIRYGSRDLPNNPFETEEVIREGTVNGVTH